MYFVEFNEDGHQEQLKLSDERPGEHWFPVGDDVEGKFFHLVNGEAVAMNDEERSTYMAELHKAWVILDGRAKRDRALIESDWTQLSNSKLTDVKKAEWETYRQALRDYPADLENNLDLEFPKKPQ